MKIKKSPLALSEPTHIKDALRFDAHALERGSVSHWRKDQIAGIFKADESAIKQVVDAWRQQKSVLSV